MSDTTVNKHNGPSEEKGKKGKRYQGYDLEKAVGKRSGRRRPWFWKILGISLLLTAVLILIVCGYIFRSKKKMTDYISRINKANTMENLLADHKNVLITTTYSHLEDGDGYTETRFVKKMKDGEYYSYNKTEGKEEDYKEVIRDKKLYRYDEKFVHFYGLIGDDYETVCLKGIEDAVFKAMDGEKIKNQKESGKFIKIDAEYEVKEGDAYTSVYGYKPGDVIEQSLTLDKESQIVLTAVETCEGEEIYSYTVEFDGQEKVPIFYQELKKQKEERKCTVYFDAEGDKEKKYTFSLPYDVYFTLLDHEGYKVYMDEDGEKEFTKYQMEVQNPESDLTLYVKKEAK